MIIEEKIPPRPQRNILQTQKNKELEDEDDELEIPAFIRRKMGNSFSKKFDKILKNVSSVRDYFFGSPC